MYLIKINVCVFCEDCEKVEEGLLNSTGKILYLKNVLTKLCKVSFTRMCVFTGVAGILIRLKKIWLWERHMLVVFGLLLSMDHNRRTFYHKVHNGNRLVT